MAASEAAFRILPGAVPCQVYRNLRSASLLSFKYGSHNYRTYGSISEKDQLTSQKYKGSPSVRSSGRIFGEGQGNRSSSLRCNCIGGERLRDTSREGTSKRLINDVAKDLDDQSLEAAIRLKHEKEGVRYNNELASDGAIGQTFGRTDSNSFEDEAWNLLRASMVHYCGNPVGTIAANDPSDSNMLNYDQVFIRDFVPSGIAFLLNGEYEIVRNFILHTLQLQVMECP